MLDIIDKVVSLRTEVGQFYRARNLPSDFAGNHTHAHYIKALGEVRKLLAACPSHNLKGDVLNPRDFMSLLGLQSDPPGAQPATKAAEGVNEDWLPDNLKGKSKKSTTPAVPMHERPIDDFGIAPEDDTEEAEVAMWFFLRDIEELRNLLKNVWTSYRDGATSLVTASFLTTEAVETVKQLQKEFFATYSSHIGTSGDYRRILHFIFQRPLSDIHAIEAFAEELSEDTKDFLMYWPWGHLQNFGDGAQPGVFNQPKPGYFPKFDPDADRHSRSREDVFWERFALFAVHMANVQLQGELSSGSTSEKTAALDEKALVGDMRSFVAAKYRTPSLALVFQWQVWYDHLMINRHNLKTPLADLQRVGRSIVDSSKLWLEIDYRPHLYTDNNVAVVEKGVKHFILDQIPRLVLEDAVGDYAKSRGGTDILPFRLYLHNPWACGVSILKLLSITGELGTTLVNGSGFVGGLLLMYDCLLQHKRIKPWPLLDRVLDIAAPVLYYAGRPKPGTFLSASLVLNGSDPRIMGKADPKYRYDGHGAGTVEITPWLCRITDGQNYRLSEKDVAALFPSGKYTTTVGAYTPRAFGREKRCTPLTLLAALKEKVEKELVQSTVSLDLFTLQMMATTFLKMWDDRGRNGFIEMWGDGYMERPSQIAFLPGQFFTALEKPEALRSNGHVVKKETTEMLFEAARVTMDVVRGRFKKWEKDGGRMLLV